MLDAAPPPPESDYDAQLRQQQLAAVEQLNTPLVRQRYDEEELFVELSRLPDHLIDVEPCKNFLLPVQPVEGRAAFSNGECGRSFVSILH